MSGPKGCGNCRKYGSIRGVFVGYCGTCLERYEFIHDWRGNPSGGCDINDLNEESMLVPASNPPINKAVRAFALAVLESIRLDALPRPPTPPPLTSLPFPYSMEYKVSFML